MKNFYYQLRKSHGKFISDDYTIISGYVVSNTELEGAGLLLESYPESEKKDLDMVEIEAEFDYGVNEQLSDRIYNGWRD